MVRRGSAPKTIQASSVRRPAYLSRAGAWTNERYRYAIAFRRVSHPLRGKPPGPTALFRARRQAPGHRRARQRHKRWPTERRGPAVPSQRSTAARRRARARSARQISLFRWARARCASGRLTGMLPVWLSIRHSARTHAFAAKHPPGAVTPARRWARSPWTCRLPRRSSHACRRRQSRPAVRVRWPVAGRKLFRRGMAALWCHRPR